MKLTVRTWAAIFIALWLISGIGLWKMRFANAWTVGDIINTSYACASPEVLSVILDASREDDGSLNDFKVNTNLSKAEGCVFFPHGRFELVDEVAERFTSTGYGVVETWGYRPVDSPPGTKIGYGWVISNGVPNEHAGIPL